MTQPTPPGGLDAAIEALRLGGMALLTDERDDGHEDNLVLAAEFATPDALGRMAAHGGGTVCLALEPATGDRYGPASTGQGEPLSPGAAIVVSIGSASAAAARDHARAIQAALVPDADQRRAVPLGRLAPLRAGQAEDAIALLRLAGLRPAAVLCPAKAVPAVARPSEPGYPAPPCGLPAVTSAGLASALLADRFRMDGAPVGAVVHRVASTGLPMASVGAGFTMHAFRDRSGIEHLALVCGDPARASADRPPLVRLHSECLTGDVFGSLRCDCGSQLQAALARIAAAGVGVLLYLRGQEGRGIGLANKVRAYALQDEGLDTVEANHRLGFAADARDWSVAAAMLRDLGVQRLALLTNNPAKVAALDGRGFIVAARVPLEMPHTAFNGAYLRTKREKMGHALPGLEPAPRAAE